MLQAPSFPPGPGLSIIIKCLIQGTRALLGHVVMKRARIHRVSLSAARSWGSRLATEEVLSGVSISVSDSCAWAAAGAGDGCVAGLESWVVEVVDEQGRATGGA